MSREAEKAELIQSVKAFLIPSSLFVACLIASAGTFLLYNGYALGWGFVAVGGTIIISAFTAMIRFQNKLRVKGQYEADADVIKGSVAKEMADRDIASTAIHNSTQRR